MIELRDLQAKYITDKNGKKTAAILPIAYSKLVFKYLR